MSQLIFHAKIKIKKERKKKRVVALFFSQTKAFRWSIRLVVSEQNFPNKQWRMIVDNERYDLQSNETNYIDLNA